MRVGSGAVAEGLPERGACASRVIGRVVGARPGPTVLAVAALHGNEPAGVEACERVLGRLSEAGIPLRGELACLAGNLRALRAGRRFLDSDLNRGWTTGRVAVARAGEGGLEDGERAALLEVIEATLSGARGPVVLVDLHTTSSRSPPFLTLGDTLRNRSFALRLGLPLVLGVEERIHGTLCEYLNERGMVAVAAEGGCHDTPESVNRLESVVWAAMEAAGCLDAQDVPDRGGRRAVLERAIEGLPPVFEVRYRRALRAGDGFRMRPGYSNFQPVRAGEIVARTNDGPVAVPFRGRIFLPLYQEQGDDGFFVVRRVRRIWLRLSAPLRHLHVEALAPVLPGVRRSRRRAGRIIADRRVARWLVVELFHLLGYRERRTGGRLHVFSRRSHDRLRASTIDRAP